jgi:Cys-tRNA(Pro)/Cys-tRNA(Cys) deacylase
MTAPADLAPARLRDFLAAHPIDAEFIAPGVPMPTVLAAAAAIGASEPEILKTLLFTDDRGAHAVVIASGTRRVSRGLLAAAAGMIKPRTASPEVVIAVTGYPAGGVAPIGLPAGLSVIVDENVAALRVAYGGGGREDLLLRIRPADIIRLNAALVTRVVE